MKKTAIRKTWFWAFLKNLPLWSGLRPSSEQRILATFEQRLEDDVDGLKKLERATHTLILQRNRAEAKYQQLKNDAQSQGERPATMALRQKIEQSEAELQKANVKCRYAKNVLQKQREEHGSRLQESRSIHEKLRGLRAQETIIDFAQKLRTEEQQLDSFPNTLEKRQRCADEQCDLGKPELGLAGSHRPDELEEYEALGKQLRAFKAQPTSAQYRSPKNSLQNISPNSEVPR